MYSIYAIFYYTPPPFYIEIYFRRNYEQARLVSRSMDKSCLLNGDKAYD